MTGAINNAAADAKFQNWIADFRGTAMNSGISASTYNRAFAGVTEIDPEVLQKAQFQPEFTEPVWGYLDNRVNEQSIATGREMARKYSRWLSAIEKSYRRRSQYPARHLVDGNQFRRDHEA